MHRAIPLLTLFSAPALSAPSQFTHQGRMAEDVALWRK
jgi:hypothetical protein